MLKAQSHLPEYEIAKIYFNGTVVDRDSDKARKATIMPSYELLMHDDYDEKNEDSIFNFSRESGNELYKCFFYGKEVTVRRNKEKYVLTYKVFKYRRLMSQLTTKLTAKQWATIEDKINASKFFELYTISDSPSPDGGSYTVEGIKDGRLQIVERFGDGSDIYPLCDYLFELAGQKLRHQIIP